MAIIYFILILGITIFIHELGHFICAKKFGVHVYEFSLGMGPKLFKFNRKNDETDYCIRLFPIGGFVQMAGEEVEVDEKIPENKRLQSKPAYQRFIIMVAGVTMNFILAIVVLFIVGLFSNISTDTLYVGSSSVDGLNNGAKITSINGNFVNNYDKLSLELVATNNKEFKMKTDDGKTTTIDPVAIGESSLIYGKDYGFSITYSEDTKNKDNIIIKDSKNKNIKDGSKILAVNGEKVNIYHDLIKELDKSKDKVLLTLDYKGKKYNEEIEVKEKKNDKIAGYSYGFSIEGKEEKGFFAAIKYAFVKFFSTIEQMFFTIIYLITGKISLKLLSGPVGMYTIVSTYSEYGFLSVLSLLSLICINVGFINLLPLPAFDGGHVLFIIIEKIKGSKVNPKVENTIHTVGLVLLMLLMLLVTYNDILRIFQK